MQEIWTAVDALVDAQLIHKNESANAALEYAQAQGLAPYHVTPAQGKFLYLLLKMIGARRVLEIGTLAGYSAIWMAGALPPDGKMVTIDSDAKHVAAARTNIERAGLSARIDVRHGKALDVLPSLAASAPFDFVFIDADKWNNPAYFRFALDHSRPGGLIVVDNVARGGLIVDEDKKNNPSVAGVLGLFDLVKSEPRVEATVLQTVGAKGYDGFLVARVIS